MRASGDRLRHLARDVAAASSAHVAARRGGLQSVAQRLNTLSPVSTLARGYAVARDESGATLGSVSQFKDGMPFELVVRDGVVPAAVRAAPRSNLENE
jgi:exodeoxyribonuclease VII large subunit